jgi:putative oxidoreductase
MDWQDPGVSLQDIGGQGMRHIGLLATRAVFGGYLAVHGAQKLFGSFGGPGLDTTGATFESMGLRPGKAAAALAGASELGGGILTATGIADPLGPLAIAGTMVVASTVHRKQGPFAQNGGYELPLTNLAMAVGLLATGSGRYRLGPAMPKWMTRLAVLGGLGLAAASVAQLLRFQPPATTAEDTDPSASDVEPS